MIVKYYSCEGPIKQAEIIDEDFKPVMGLSHSKYCLAVEPTGEFLILGKRAADEIGINGIGYFCSAFNKSWRALEEETLQKNNIASLFTITN